MAPATRLLFVLAAALGTLAAPGGADEYWITYEANDLPENEGWNRYWGNADGEYQGDGAIRTIEDGILTMDSLYDPEIYDSGYLELPGQIDPDPGEIFVVEWRLKVERVDGSYDPSVALCSDNGWAVAFQYNETSVGRVFENDEDVPILPEMFHEYRLLSSDMQLYELYIDGDLAIEGTFWQGVCYSYVGWGDSCHPAGSRSQWDYFRFGVMPEPNSMMLILGALVAARTSSSTVQKFRKVHNKEEC